MTVIENEKKNGENVTKRKWNLYILFFIIILYINIHEHVEVYDGFVVDVDDVEKKEKKKSEKLNYWYLSMGVV